MVDDILSQVRRLDGLKNAIIGGVELEQAANAVTVRLVTDLAYSHEEYLAAYDSVRHYVPECFSLDLKISKLTPDCDMIKRRILALIGENFPALASVTEDGDVTVSKTDEGFSFEVATFSGSRADDVIRTLENSLKKTYCGTFCAAAPSLYYIRAFEQGKYYVRRAELVAAAIDLYYPPRTAFGEL